MLVSEFFANLTYGVLSNLSIGSETPGQIPVEHQPRLIIYTNQTLNRLYARFAHKRDYVTFQQQEGVLRYALIGTHAVSNTDPSNTATRFILDTVDEPFQDDLLKILSITQLPMGDEEHSVELALNDRTKDGAARTISFNTLRIAKPEQDRKIEVEYLAAHSKLTQDYAAQAQTIELSPLLEHALECGVAAKVFRNMGGEDGLTRSNELLREYEASCKEAETHDLLQVTFTAEHDRLTEKGWV